VYSEQSDVRTLQGILQSGKGVLEAGKNAGMASPCDGVWTYQRKLSRVEFAIKLVQPGCELWQRHRCLFGLVVTCHQSCCHVGLGRNFGLAGEVMRSHMRTGTPTTHTHTKREEVR